jgi:hypothetical protein
LDNNKILLHTLTKISNVQQDISELKQESQFIKGSAVKIENAHGKKLDALFDGDSSNFGIIAPYFRSGIQSGQTLF